MRKPDTWPAVRQILEIHRRYGKDSGPHFAAALTYYAILSVFPLLLLALALAGYVLADAGREDAARLADRLARDVPGLGPLIGRDVEAVIRRRGLAGLIGIAGIVWGGTGGIAATREALGKVFRFDVPINTFVARLHSLGLLVVLGPLALLSVAATGLATNIGSAETPSRWLLSLGGLVVGFALDVALFALVYRVFVPAGVARTRALWPGALFSAAGFTLVKLLGSAYAHYVVQRASMIYGTFAGIIGALVVLNLSATIFLYGAELTAIRLGRRRAAT